MVFQGYGAKRTWGTEEKAQWLSRRWRALAMRSQKEPSGVCASALLPGRRRRLALLVTCMQDGIPVSILSSSRG